MVRFGIITIFFKLDQHIARLYMRQQSNCDSMKTSIFPLCLGSNRGPSAWLADMLTTK